MLILNKRKYKFIFFMEKNVILNKVNKTYSNLNLVLK